MTTTQETTLPGISPFKNQAAPVKITNVQLQGAPAERHNWGQSVQYSTTDDPMGHQQDNLRGKHQIVTLTIVLLYWNSSNCPELQQVYLIHPVKSEVFFYLFFS